MDSADKNVTLRLRKNKSMNMLHNIDNSMNSSLSEDILCRSLDLSTNNIQNSCMEEMKNEIQLLKISLESTQNELENVIIENSDLKNQIIHLTQEIKTLKQICTSPRSSLRKNKHSSNITGARRRLVNSFSDSPDIFTLQKSDSQKSKDIQPVTQTLTPHEKLGNTEKSKHKKPSGKKSAITENETQLGNNSLIKDTRRKRKLCIVSNCNYHRPVEIIEDVFAQQFEYCHYVSPNSRMKEILTNITNKIQDFNMDDYCIIMIGDQDFKGNEDSIELVKQIRETLKHITFTNIIICTPVYVTGALIHNYKVEMFNNLLHMDIEYYNYAYFFDTNRNLTLEMFSYKTGKLNRLGIKCIFESIFNRMSVDIQDYPIDYEYKNKIITSTSQVQNIQNHFFRPTP